MDADDKDVVMERFNKIISFLSTITYHSSPLEKLYLIDRVCESITENAQIEPDQILKVVFYCVLKLNP